jgi:hypothetical protein
MKFKVEFNPESLISKTPPIPSSPPQIPLLNGICNAALNTVEFVIQQNWK